MTTPADTPNATDRSQSQSSVASLSGLELLRAMERGDLPMPPAARLLGIRGVEFQPGAAVFEMAAAAEHYNPLGVIHGGLLATLLDTAMGCAVHSVLPAGVSYTTLEFKINFVRAATLASGTLRAHARLVHEGGRTAVAEGRIEDGHGRLVAHGTTTCLVLRPDARADGRAPAPATSGS